MATIHIDRLLDTVVKQDASDLHLAVGKKPTLRIRGRLVELSTKVLEPADTVALMKSITPERSQNELQEEGGSDFGFAYGEAARFRVSIFKQKGNVSLVLRQIPNELLPLEVIGLPDIVRDTEASRLTISEGKTTLDEIAKIAQVEGIVDIDSEMEDDDSKVA